jgi:hypothetical protein
MISDTIEQFCGLPQYSRLEQDGTVEDCCEKGVVRHKGSSQRPQYCYLVLSGLCVIFAGVAGYIFGTLKCHGLYEVAHLAGTVSQGKASPRPNQTITNSLFCGSTHWDFQEDIPVQQQLCRATT